MLYMRTATVTAPDVDRTARARIVDAAFVCFTSSGYASASVRQIAAAAGVSPALLTHHFGSKAAVRAECDARVEVSMGAKVSGDRESLDAVIDTYGPYLAATLDDDIDSARRLFARLVDLARDAIADPGSGVRPTGDRDGQAVALVVLGLAPFAWRRRLDEWAEGTDAGIRRIAGPLAEVFTRGFMVDDRLEGAR